MSEADWGGFVDLADMVVVNKFDKAGADDALRDVLGQRDLDELLTKRDELNIALQKILDKATDAWGIKVSSVNSRDELAAAFASRKLTSRATAV